MSDPSQTERSVSDGQLLAAHLGGDAKAFAVLVGRYRRELFSFLCHLTGDPTLAEDVFQDTFLQVHLSAGAFDTDRAFKPWLFTIAANKARDALRHRHRRAAAPLDAPVGAPGEGATYAELMPADVPAPDARLMNLQTRQAVEQVIARMPEAMRTVLLLCYFHELPYRDAAEILNVPLGTVKSRLHAAIRHFARQWQAVAKRFADDPRQD